MIRRPFAPRRLVVLVLLVVSVATPALGPDRAVAARQDDPGTQARATTPRPAHIHAGTCDDLGIVVFSLNAVQSYGFDPDGSGRELEVIVGTADVEITDLFAEDFALHVHESEQNKQNYIACGAIGEQPPPPWKPSDGLSIDLTPQADSGYSGFVSLRPETGGGTTVTFVLVPPAPEGSAEVQTTAEPGSGGTYDSPTYGYSLDFDDTWTIEDETSDNEIDRVVLSNGTSFMTLVGTPEFDGDTSACVTSFAKEALLDPAVGEVTPALDADGKPLTGSGEATGAFAVFDHDYTFSDGTTIPYSLFVGCAPLEPGGAVLAVLQNVPRAAFNDQVPARDSLLKGLRAAAG